MTPATIMSFSVVRVPGKQNLRQTAVVVGDEVDAVPAHVLAYSSELFEPHLLAELPESAGQFFNGYGRGWFAGSAQ